MFLHLLHTFLHIWECQDRCPAQLEQGAHMNPHNKGASASALTSPSSLQPLIL